ncbi:MAG: 30S ribosome-binding factor RbfA [Cyanobacteriota bacterium]|jgi:ribosome-binding factor A
MAQGRRVERVASLMRREISDLLSSGIRDARVHQGMVSVTSVDVAGDLQHCKVFVSVYGTEEERGQAMEGLKAATPYVRGELGRRLALRRIPEVLFVLDRSLERGSAVLGLLNALERERLHRRPDGPPPSDGAPSSDGRPTPASNADEEQAAGDDRGE